MKPILFLMLIFSSSTSFCQWTRVQQLPAADIFTLFQKNNTLYAGGRNIIYISRNNGQSWDSTAVIPQLPFIQNIIEFKNDLYAASFSKGVFKSADAGASWQNISAGIFPFVSDFCEFRGELYAATLGDKVYKLDPVNSGHWLPFGAGLSNSSSNINTIAANDNAMVAGTTANGMYGYLAANSAAWQERLLTGQLKPVEGVYDIIAAHDSLFLAGTTGTLYMSTDNGLGWNVFGQSFTPGATSLANTKEALILSRVVGGSNTSFFYIKKDSLQGSLVPFSLVPDHFTYKIAILGDKLWDASTDGLFFMSLKDLPGITAADDPGTFIPLPVHFISFNADCDGSRVLVRWKTAQEPNSSHFDIERSVDGSNWAFIYQLPAVADNSSGASYSFADSKPARNGYYRIAAYDLDGRVQYTNILQAGCTVADAASLWPNPARDIVFVRINAINRSKIVIRIADSKGAVVKVQESTLFPGINHLVANVKALTSGIYFLSAEWSNGQMKKTFQLMKQ